MTSSLQDLQTFFAWPPGSEGAMSALQRLPEPQRRLLLAVRGLKDYAQLPVPGDLGFGILARLDAAYPQLLAQPSTDRPWLVRASAGLFGLTAEFRAAAAWEHPASTPLFMALSAPRAEPVLISPLRLAIDALALPRPCFRDTLAALLAFHEGQRPLPEHVFRVDRLASADSLRAPWQSAWSLVAACGTFQDGAWDFDFSIESLELLGKLLVHGEDGAAEGVALGIRAVDADRRRRDAWLLNAATGYLGEALRLHLGARWAASGPGERSLQLTFGRPDRTLEPAGWVRATAARRDPHLLVRLGAWMRRAVVGQLPWPSPSGT